MLKKSFVMCVVFSISLILFSCDQNKTESPSIPTPDAAEIGAQEEIIEETLKTDQSISLQMETDHFMLHSADEDISVLEDIAQTLEGECERITTSLQVELESKVPIFIYPDLEMFHSAISRESAPDWLVGVAVGSNFIKMVSPNNPGSMHNYESIIQVSLHEFVHVVAGKISTTAPAYLCEGVAAYMSAQSQGIDNVLSQAFNESNFPTFDELLSLNGDSGLYQFGYSFVEYIVTEYGYEKLVEFYKSPSDITTVFGVSKEEFQINWIEYLKTAYPSSS